MFNINVYAFLGVFGLKHFGFCVDCNLTRGTNTSLLILAKGLKVSLESNCQFVEVEVVPLERDS